MPVPFFNLAFLENFYGVHRNFQALAEAPGGNGYPHNIFAFAITVLISAVNFKYQNLQQSPFETHPKTTVSGIIVLHLYILAFDAQQRLRNHIHHPMALAEFIFIHRSLVFLGYISVAILSSLIIPSPASPVVYAICVAISVGDVVVLMRGWLMRRRMNEAEQGIPA